MKASRLPAQIAGVRPGRYGLAVLSVGALGYAVSSLSQREVHAEAPPNGKPAKDEVEIIFEQRKAKPGLSKESNRDIISSQHLQVKQSWENPGVYVWGSNSGKVVAPESNESVVKTPRRLTYFDGQLLRDLKLSRNFGAAIDEKGNLLLWGSDYDPKNPLPSTVLAGKDLRQLAVSQDRVFALAKNGTIYSISVSKENQLSGPKKSESSWIPFWSSTADVSYRTISPPKTDSSGKITSIACGLSHGIFTTASGKAYSFASSSSEFPSKGQLGVPGVSWSSRPEDEYDMPHKIASLSGFDIKSVASGDNHSLVLDSTGRVFGFGDNSSGQLGIDFTPESQFIDAPALLPIQKVYAGTSQVPRVTSIAAGGLTSFMTIDATRVASPNDDNTSASSRAQIGRVSADVLSFGQGILGTLGNSRWTHMQPLPQKVKTLSGLYEYDEKNKSTIPIRLAAISVGATHAAATMDNVTYLDSSAKSSENDTNWGADVVWWGGNEFYQLGTGKRNNVSTPVYIGPLESNVDGTKREEHRFHLTPRKQIKFQGRWVDMEQKIECGRMNTAVYSRVIV